MPDSIDFVCPALSRNCAPPAERYAAGRAQRDALPRAAHTELPPAAGRTDPLHILAQQDQTRLQELIPLRYGRMSATPFTYLRGAAAVMADDLGALPRTELNVELCGDAHLGNFRWYHAPNRELVFDLNDFDETLPGPFEWDLKRLAASVTVAARNNGFSDSKARAAARSAMRSYRKAMGSASALNPLELHYYRFETAAALDIIERHGKQHRKWKQEVLKKASRKNSMRAFKKLTRKVDGRHVIVPDPPLIERIDDQLETSAPGSAADFYDSYRQSLPLDRRVLLDQFKPVDVARKVVGVGSVGTRCLILLLVAGDGTPLFLQFKQAVASVLETHLGASRFDQAGQRVVEGQRLIQATSDVLLGWARHRDETGREIDFYFRQLWDGKGKIDVDELGPKRLAAFAGLCGKTLAFAHARSGDPMAIRGYIGEDNSFDKIMVEFADRYADLTAADHAQLLEAIADRRIQAVRDI